MKRFRIPFFAALLLLIVGGTGAQSRVVPVETTGGTTERDSARAAPSFSDVQPLIEGTFAPLLTEDGELDASSWQGLIEGSEHGEVLIPYDADNSLLVEVAEQALAGDRPGAPTEDGIAQVRRWINAGAKSDEGKVPYADADQLLYVPNQGEAIISVVDMEQGLVIRTVDLTERGFDANAKPHHTAVEPGGAHWYVSLIGANRVLKLNRDNEIIGRVEFEVPGMMTMTPQSDRLYVARSMSAVNPPKRIGIIGREDLSLEQIDVFFPRPHAIGVSPSGQQAYVASLARNQIAGVNTASGAMELTSMNGPVNTLVHFDVSPDGETLVAGGQLTGKFFFFEVPDEAPLQPRVVDSLQIGGQPWHPIYTPDGGHIYVPNKTANTVTVIDANAREVETVIEGDGLAQPHGSAVRPDGRYVYISNNNRKGAYTPRYDLGDNRNAGTVTVIDTRTNEIEKVIEVEDYPTGLGTLPPER